LAAAVHGAGVHRVSGRLVVDDTRYDRIRAAPGWAPGDLPAYIGPLSALVVSRNHYRGDPGFVVDPSPANLALFRRALERRGVVVLGPDTAGPAPSTASVVASLSSEPLEALVARMMTHSDNLIAELLLKEVGLVAKGEGSTAAGIAAADELLLKFGIGGSSADGSGLSGGNLRPVREWAVLLETVRRLPVGQALIDSLAVAGQTGTLGRRLAGPMTKGNVRAKTGAIAGVRALSGYLTTAAGRPAVFSIVVNGSHTGPAVTRAIDAVVTTIAADRS
jgi:D-alanyl-D-alanine carboxypeptidase/D-alanyl-D-alanine-endopeptidase (penicillin-binding protein 4)